MGLTIALVVTSFTTGLLVGLCLGYFRLSQWYRQKTGRSLRREVEKYG